VGRGGIGGTEWDKIRKVVVDTADEVCGRKGGRVVNPWTLGREGEIEVMRRDINRLVEARNEVVGRQEYRNRLRNRGREGEDRIGREVEAARQEVRRARGVMKSRLRAWEREWWEGKIRECEEASRTGRVGDMYKILRSLGTRGWKAPASTTITSREFREHFEGVSRDRYEEDRETIEEVLGRVRDLRGDRRAEEADELMNEEPGEEEIEEAIGEIRESAPGEDGVRIGYIRRACREIRDRVVGMVQFMFRESADRWEEGLKGGLVVPLHKKGDRNNRDNYRGVCLLAMGSRILARVVSKRLRWWAEELGLVEENQAGFRRGRSTADATQVMVRIWEDSRDYRLRTEGQGNREPQARLLDLRKAYPRVNKPCLWSILEKYGLGGNCLRVIRDLHETTEYRVRGKEGVSEGWLPARGLREGCATSPVLFNV